MAKTKDKSDKATKLLFGQLVNGVSPKRLSDSLIGKGLEPELAEKLVNKAVRKLKDYKKTEEGREEFKLRYKKQMLRGGFGIFVGTGISVLSIFLSDFLGGYYVITWGLALWGVVEFVRGLVAFVRVQ